MNALPVESLKALARAEEAIEAAEFDIQGGFYLAAANRAYYGCYYCMISLLISQNASAKTHQGVRAKFSELFIKTKLLPERMATHIRSAFELRQEADYDLDAEISPDVINELVSNTKDVYRSVSTYLESLKTGKDPSSD
jgi:uncharacterized protein (UPF0332 family)